MNLPLDALRTAAIAASAAAAGWWLHGLTGNAAAVPPLPQPAKSVAAARGAAVEAPLVLVSSDGQATLRVEQQPLDWVLEEIARQSGRSDVRRQVAANAAEARDAAAPLAAPAVPEAACPEPAAPPNGVEPARLRAAIERGSEDERFDGLMQARNDSVVLPAALLKSIAETDASERVRLVAFDAWLEQHADRPEAVRAALDAALSMPGAAVQAEARRRLDELNASERVDPDDSQAAAR